MLRPVLFILIVTSLECNGDLSILSSLPAKFINDAGYLFSKLSVENGLSLPLNKEDSKEITPTITENSVKNNMANQPELSHSSPTLDEDKNNQVSDISRSKLSETSMQKVADQQGDHNKNLNLKLNDNLGDVNIESFGRSVNYNYGTFSQNLRG